MLNNETFRQSSQKGDTDMEFIWLYKVIRYRITRPILFNSVVFQMFCVEQNNTINYLVAFSCDKMIKMLLFHFLFLYSVLLNMDDWLSNQTVFGTMIVLHIGC